MANITLDSQIFIANPMAADRISTSPNLWAPDGDPSVVSSRGPKTPQHATHDPQRGAGGASQDDAVLISTDDESDYGDLDDGTSDISFPPIEELLLAAGRKHIETGSVAGVDRSLSVTPGVGGNSDAVEPSVTEGANPDDEVAPSQQQQTPDLQRSPALPSASALLQPSSASPRPLQMEQDRAIPADS
ncbi:hypothetical protein GE09DRAFT_1213625 [Coniochaeta sp. 2T2.1]|nr:hypothetical protein GE09DRAFT_1213625 [Coniochaeta sp. 2T2.1]